MGGVGWVLVAKGGMEGGRRVRMNVDGEPNLGRGFGFGGE